MTTPPAHHRDTVPAWAWANVLSIDAVTVGLVWLFVFTDQFCHRSPAGYELAIIGLSIWLVYTADRLLDSLHLDTTQSHTIRHLFHFRHRKTLGVAWVLILVLDAALIVSNATEPQLRWGCAAIAAVLAYVASVQFLKDSVRRFPKELQAGMVFAFGVSLNAWVEAAADDVMSLVVSVVMTALVFTANCVTIAALECDVDRVQRFDSWVLRSPLAARVLPIALGLHASIVSGLGLAGIIPATIAFCLIASDVLLMSLGRTLSTQTSCGSAGARPGPWVTLADVALVFPAVVFCSVSTVL
ncbi:hypothetical protein Mal15_16370 [Stieleria maiorica]|uniref:Prenyltransferase n=1 Tax=Stieleria maiorica TaxID=2795974 RepID=A0A5B9MBH5_9BACT|nr:hypothetical protein [Stieleria maiorica]QEF97596.1 hypothetical protein Mal15_16370 [Stieleria maiorica]